MNRPLLFVVPMVVCAVAMLAAAARALDPQLVLLSWDFEGHLLRSQVWLSDVAGTASLFGWFPYWHGGFPMTEVYPPLATWLLAIPALYNVAEAGGRVVLLALWIGAVPASFHFLRRFGVSPLAASLAACLVGALDASRTFGVQALFWLGLIPNGLGFVLAILTLAETKMLLTDRPTLRQACRAGLLGGLTVLAHPFCAYWLGVAVIALAAAELPGRADMGRRVGAGAVAAVGAAAVGAWYWAPFVAGRSNLLVTDPFVSVGVAAAGRALAVMRDAGGLPALALALLGATALAATTRRRTLVFFALLAAFSLALSLGAAPAMGAFAGPSQRARFEGFYLWTLLMMAGFGLDAAFTSTRPWRLAAVLGLTAVTAWVSLAGVWRQRVNVGATGTAAVSDLKRLSAELATTFRPGDLLYSENDPRAFRALGSPHFFNQRLPVLNPLYWDAGGGLPEGTRGSEPLFSAAREFPGSVVKIRETLAHHGVRFVLTERRESAEALSRIPWLVERWPGPSDHPKSDIALFEVVAFENRLGLPPGTSAHLRTVAYTPSGGYRLTFDGDAPLAYPLETAISFHPWLRGTADDGTPLALAPTADGRLSVAAGPATAATLSFVYRPPAILAAVRVAALLVLVALLAFSFALPAA